MKWQKTEIFKSETVKKTYKPLETGHAIYRATDRYDSVQCSAVFQLLRRGPWGN